MFLLAGNDLLMSLKVWTDPAALLRFSWRAPSRRALQPAPARQLVGRLAALPVRVVGREEDIKPRFMLWSRARSRQSIG